jgi:DNA-binding NtrC family response regulator
MADIRTPNILFVDDDQVATNALIQSLKRRDSSLRYSHAKDSQEALELTRNLIPEVAIVDLSLDTKIGPSSGLELIAQLLAIDTSLRILVLTGHDSKEFGVKALHHGAASFIEKPADSDHVLALIRDGLTFAQLKREFIRLENESEDLPQRLGVSSKSPEMKQVLQTAAFAASNLRPVLLAGQTGTGKGVLAQAIHQGSINSAGRTGPFIRFQPSFLSSDLVASELFGHEKGAFTGADTARSGLIEEANGGTLFIDEVDELPQNVQVLLLNVIQEQTFRRLGSNNERHSDFRLITATNYPLESLISEKKLRRDFYHRIAHAVIKLPSLHERKEDIAQLANYFINNLELRENIGVHGLSSDALAVLRKHHWPGNIRELQSVIEGGAYLAAFREKRFVDASDLDLPGTPHSSSMDTSLSFRERVRRYEYQLIKETLEKCENNQSQAASMLQLDRTSLRRILKREEN